MRTASTVARYLLGTLFTIFGLNGLLEYANSSFIHQPPPTNPLALEFIHAAGHSYFAFFFFGVQFIAGLLLLSGLFVALSLIMLAAEIFNILAFHLSFAPAAIGPGLLAGVLWLLTFRNYRESFRGVLSRKPVAGATA